LQTLLEVMPVGIGIARDRACERIDVNAAFARLLGVTIGDNASLSARNGERPSRFACWQDDHEVCSDQLPMQVAARTGAVVRGVEFEVRRDDGHAAHVLAYAAPLLDAQGATFGAVGAFVDISERKRAEAERQALMEQADAERAKLEAVLNQMPAGVMITEAAPAEAAWGRIVLLNEQVDQIWRLEASRRAAQWAAEARGFHADGRLYEPREWPLARALTSGERVAGEEIEIIRGDGTRGHISVNAGPILDGNGNIVAAVVTFYDITERKLAQSTARKQQAELIHLSRLSTMGQMAAGLAHELNQPLGAILNYAGVCLDRVSADEEADEKVVKALEEVAGETRRAGEIIRRLRGFARKEKPNVRPLRINHVVREAVAMVSTELHYAGVPVEFQLCDSLPPALADGVQIEQVMVNLVRNAIDAMDDTHPALRRLVVRTEMSGDGEDGGDGDGDGAGGETANVRVSVIDAGCGVSPEVRARIFDSFFTTKPDGLGMGLPICQAIIQGHGGDLGVTNNNGDGGGVGGGGTTVHFTLPLVRQPQEALQP
jgi:PAS domain S-box-containing protein